MIMMVVMPVPMRVAVTAMSVMMVMPVIVIAVGADAAHVIVVADLRRALVGLVAQNLLPVLTEEAVHQVRPVQRFTQALDEGVDDQRMVIEIVGLDDLDVGMRRLAFVGAPIDAFDENAGEQEIREDDDAPIAEPDRMLQPLVHQRIRDPGVADLGPAEAHAL